MQKIDRSYIRRVRYAVQWGLLTLILFGGYRLASFIDAVMSGAPEASLSTRPQLVDGFLPIGGMMSIRHWAEAGFIEPTHPAALFILLAAIVVSFVLMKSFCGWVCPIGTISEALHKLGHKIFGRNFTIHRFIDYPLRALKYVLLGFFLWIIFLKMPIQGIAAFMADPYWKIADIKMLRFFTEMSSTTAITLGVLGVLSVAFKNFWCRYLCPYGALTGLLGLISPSGIRRDNKACINCHKCTRSCPNLIDVEMKDRVRSPECTGCLTCVSVCPAKGALDTEVAGIRMKPAHYAAAVLVIYFGIIGGAMMSGHWRSNVTPQEYRALLPQIERLGHP